MTETSGQTWLLSGVYASTDYRERRNLWKEIPTLVDQGIPIVIVRDFNFVLHLEDKRDERPFVEDIGSKECYHFMQHNALLDLGFVGPCFTWCNNRSGRARVWERLIESWRRLAGSNGIPLMWFSISRGLGWITVRCFFQLVL